MMSIALGRCATLSGANMWMSRQTDYATYVGCELAQSACRGGCELDRRRPRSDGLVGREGDGGDVTERHAGRHRATTQRRPGFAGCLSVGQSSAIRPSIHREASDEHGDIEPSGAGHGGHGAGAEDNHLPPRVEAESIYIMRKVMATADKPVMLYSIGKGS